MSFAEFDVFSPIHSLVSTDDRFVKQKLGLSFQNFIRWS